MSCPVFISYKRVDKQKVFAIKDYIEQRTGAKCWIDLDGIESHAQFVSVIINAIDECQIVLFMYSQAHSLIKDYEKDYTIKELTYAAEEGKRIVFINIDRSPLAKWFRFQYGTKQHVDALDPTRLDKLAADIRNWLNLPAPKPADNAGQRTATQQPYASSTSGQRTATQQPYAPSTPVQRTTTQQPYAPSTPVQRTTTQPTTALNDILYTITLASAGAAKLQVVKAVMEALRTGLKEAKDLVDATPTKLPGTYNAVDTIRIKNFIEAAGATMIVNFATAADEGTARYSLTLVSTGAAKLQVVKAIKEALSTGLKEAKDLVDAAPVKLPNIYAMSQAKRIKDYIEAAGATMKMERV